MARWLSRFLAKDHRANTILPASTAANDLALIERRRCELTAISALALPKALGMTIQLTAWARAGQL